MVSNSVGDAKLASKERANISDATSNTDYT